MMNNSRDSLRRALLLTLFGLIGLVTGLGFLSSGCDKKAPTIYEEIDSAATIFEPEDTVFWEQDSVYVLQIETTETSMQGMHELVAVTMNRSQHQVAGFDFMLAYDASALVFQAAIPGVLHTECGWEYFNYRFGPNGNCGNTCPSGMLEVIAIAETNNGPNHPDMDCTDSIAVNGPDTLFQLDFLISNDRTLECQFANVRFFWTNCTDNSIAYHPSDDPLSSVQGVSRYVIDFVLSGQFADGSTGFPTYTGVQDVCLAGSGPGKPVPVQIVDFINGGVDIVCADSIDGRGDINLNGNSNEIADVVLFSNYFVRGIGVFNVNYQGQLAASDVNENGVPLEVADLVYLIRIVTGDANPYPNLTPEPASLTHNGGVLSINTKLGAAFVVVEGNVNPTLLAIHMEMSHHYDGSRTRILVSKIERTGFEGDFLQLNGSIVSVECATYDGTPIVLDGTVAPRPAIVVSNHPNPFRDTTIITYAVPSGAPSVCSIFNAAGARVARFTHDGVGVSTRIEWDASEQLEGIYTCRVEADGLVATNTMLKVNQ